MASQLSNMFSALRERYYSSLTDDDLFSSFLTTFLGLSPFIALLILFVAVLLFLQWCVEKYRHRGLNEEELKKLRKIKGNQIRESHCSICLSGIKPDNEVQLVPGCNHGFHSHCIRIWLSNEPTCPLCRSNVKDSLKERADDILC